MGSDLGEGGGGMNRMETWAVQGVNGKARCSWLRTHEMEGIDILTSGDIYVFLWGGQIRPEGQASTT